MSMNKQALWPDLLITIPTVLLLSLGILVIYSSDGRLALQQIVFALVGLALYWLVSIIDFEFLSHYSRFTYWVVLGLLIIVFLLGVETRGSLRWIPLGFIQLQPSEFAKPALILFLAHFWSNNIPTWRNIFKSFLWTLPFLLLIFRQPDLGTALTLLSIWIMTIIAANISTVRIFLMGIVAGAMTPTIWFLMKDYQRARITTFLFPDQDPLGSGYNVIQSMVAVGSGQLFGRGLGRGTQSRLQFLPEFRTDFIFASIAEEFGFLGSMIVFLLYGIIILRSIAMIKDEVSRFSSILVFGVLGMFIFQLVVNIGMNVGIIPVTGITLPLLSYGGSSLVATLISLGFIASVSRYGHRAISFGRLD